MGEFTLYELNKVLKDLNKKVDQALCCCESLEGKNLGNGFPIYVSRFKDKLKFKTIEQGANISITDTGNTLVISSTTSVTPEALTKVDDTNVTLTLGGTPATALLQPVNLTLGWTGTLADSRITSASNWNTAYNNRIDSLTTLGTSGPATLAGNILNIPDYSSGTGFVPTSRTLTINGTTYDLTANRTWNVGTVTSVELASGTGISLSGTNPITSSGIITVTNTAPDQTVVLNSGTGINISGTYPNFTIANTGTFTSPLTTKGDIYVRNSTSDTRLPVGLDTQILYADSSTTTGLKWGSNSTPPASGYYGGWQDTTTQTAAASNVGYEMYYNTADVTPNGISLVNNGSGQPTRITFANTGIYNLQFSSQFQNIDNAEHDVTIWLRKNSVDIPGSAGFVQVPKRRAAGAGNEGHVIVAWNYLLSVVGGEYYELVWSTTNHTNITMQFYAAGSPPPSTASVIITVTQQSGIMAGTGLTAINSLTGAVQTMAVGTSGTDFAISSAGTTHTFNLPTASATNRGLLSTTDWSTFNSKQAALSGSGLVKSTGGTISYITDNSTNWDTAYTDRYKWDGGSSGLVAATGRTSLGLGTFAVVNYPTWVSGTPFVKMTAAGTFSLDTNTYLTGNQSITLSGDVTGTGTTAITTAIGNNKVTNAMLVQVATATFKGRTSASTGNVEDLTAVQATALLDTFTSTLKGLAPASGGGTTNFLRADGTWAVPSGGGGSVNGSGSANQLAYWINGNTINNLSTSTYPDLTEVSYVKGVTTAIQTQLNGKQASLSGTGFVKISGTTISYDNSTYLTANQSITLSGDVTGTGSTAITTTIANNAVSNAKFRQSSGLSVVGRAGTTTGNVADITGVNAFSTLRVNSGATSLEFGGGFTPLPFYIGAGVTTATTTNYFFFTSPAIAGVAAASKAARQVSYPAGSWKNLYIRTSSTQPATGSLVFSLHVNNTTTAISITIAAGSAAGFFSDTTNTGTTAAGDYVCWEMVNNASAASATIASGNIGFVAA